MKILLPLIALIASLTACGKPSGDAAVQKKLAATWTSDGDPSTTIEMKPDGSWVAGLPDATVVKGTWKFAGGYIIMTMLNVPSPDGKPMMESNKVVSIEGDKMVLQSARGVVREISFHKK